MAKRRFEESQSEGTKRVKFDDDGNKKHSLDSDEEEDYAQQKHYDVMLDDDIEGQEESTLTYDGSTKITPFNMKEELEEGHFDVDGNYHWEQKGKMVADAWIENIDEVKIVNRPIVSDSDSESDDGVPFDSVPVYKQLLRLMKPGENVKKTLCRLGGKKPMLASERWKKKKAGESCEDSYNRSQVVEVTELADRLLTKLGNMDIYQETYEHISNIVYGANPKKKSKGNIAAMAVDDVLDMYADDFDEKEKERLAEKDTDVPEDKLQTLRGTSEEENGAKPHTLHGTSEELNLSTSEEKNGEKPKTLLSTSEDLHSSSEEENGAHESKTNEAGSVAVPESAPLTAAE